MKILGLGHGVCVYVVVWIEGEEGLLERGNWRPSLASLYSFITGTLAAGLIQRTKPALPAYGHIQIANTSTNGK